MDQKIFNNIIFLLIIVLIIKQISPDKDSVLYILKKYLNYIIFKIRNIFSREDFIGTTFSGLKKFEKKAPYILNEYDKKLIMYLKTLNSNASDIDIKKLLSITNSIISISTDSYFSTPSDEINYKFDNNEIEKIKTILLTKLNKYNVKFSNLNLDLTTQKALYYYNNSAGKEVKPFIMTVDTDNGFKNLKIYFDINIRNDIKKGAEYLVINNARIIIDPTFEIVETSSMPSPEPDENVFNYLPHLENKYIKPIKVDTRFNELDYSTYIKPTTEIDYSGLNDNQNIDIFQSYKEFEKDNKDIIEDYPNYSQPSYSQEFDKQKQPSYSQPNNSQPSYSEPTNLEDEEEMETPAFSY